MESYGENDLDADLEHLFVEIISPVATVLDGMKPDDKLIIVAPEVCNSISSNAKSWSRSLVFDDCCQLKTCSTPEFHVVETKICQWSFAHILKCEICFIHKMTSSPNVCCLVLIEQP
jgi:hypothetical protein